MTQFALYLFLFVFAKSQTSCRLAVFKDFFANLFEMAKDLEFYSIGIEAKGWNESSPFFLAFPLHGIGLGMDGKKER